MIVFIGFCYDGLVLLIMLASRVIIITSFAVAEQQLIILLELKSCASVLSPLTTFSGKYLNGENFFLLAIVSIFTLFLDRTCACSYECGLYNRKGLIRRRRFMRRHIVSQINTNKCKKLEIQKQNFQKREYKKIFVLC